MLLRYLRRLAYGAALSAALTSLTGIHPAFASESLTRDLMRAAERAFGSGHQQKASPAVGSLPPASTSFQACADHFYGGAAPRVEQPAEYGTLRALCYDRFAVLHSSAMKGPLFSAERLSAADLHQGAKVKRPDGRTAFFPDARLPERERSQLQDYAGQGHIPKEDRRDRGHLTPAREMTDDRSMAQSFSLANVVPQNSVNNEQIWTKIEKDTRSYIMRAHGSVTVITGAQYDPNPPRVGPGRIAVPTAMYKLVYDETTGRAWAHWLPNTATAQVGHPISYAELVKRTGIDFLPRASM